MMMIIVVCCWMACSSKWESIIDWVVASGDEMTASVNVDEGQHSSRASNILDVL